MSHPMWVRGLKHECFCELIGASDVAPYVGAWIETANDGFSSIEFTVAPYVGAWIETANDGFSSIEFTSHPMWVRGLKPG